MNKKSSLRSFLANIYGFSFFNALVLLSPVYAIFMQDHGMSDMQLSSLFIMWSVGILVSQVPIVWLTGKIGVKNMIVIGQILKVLGFTMWIVFPTYIGFMIGFLLWGVQGATYNVVYEGMLYNELHARQHHAMYTKVLGKRKNLSTLGGALSAAGSLLLFFGYGAIAAASAASVLISAVFIMRIKLKYKLPKVKVKKKQQQSFGKLFITGAKIVRQTPCILYMLVFCAILENFSFLGDHYGLIGADIGLRPEFVGIVPFTMLCCKMLGQASAHRFTQIKDWKLYASVSVAGGIFVLFSIFYSVSSLFLLGMGATLFAAVEILIYSRFQDFIPSSHRSVVLSIYNTADQMMYAAACLVIGLGGTFGGWRYGVLMLGMICIALGLWAVLFVKDKCAISENPNIKVVKTIEPTSSASPSRF